MTEGVEGHGAGPQRPGELVVGGVRLRYDVSGSGEPLLLVHGFPLSRRMWQPLAERLGDDHLAIAPDLRGHGESEASESVSMARYADDLAALLDEIGERRPVVLVGLSMGGYVAFEFCRRHAARVRALVLVDTRAEADSEEAARGRRESADRALQSGSGDVAEAMAGKLFAAEAPAALRERWREQMAANPPEGVAAALRAMAVRPDSFDTLRGLSVPVMIVVGEEDAITPPSAAREMAAAAPGARLEIVPGAGHLTPVEQPDRFAELLRDFLSSLPPVESAEAGHTRGGAG
jgi:3-oxoadipate enol-lactonase